DRPGEVLVAVEAAPLVGREEAEVEVAEVMIHGAAAGDPPHHMDAALLHQPGLDLLDGILVPADDDRRLVDVEEAALLAGIPVAEHVLLEREVEARIGDAAVVDE